MHHHKRAALWLIAVLCFMLTIASKVMGEPTHTVDASQAEEQPSNDNNIDQLSENEVASQANRIPNVAEKQGAEVTWESLYGASVVLASNGIPDQQTLARTDVNVLKREHPGLIERVLNSTRNMITRAVGWLGTRYIWGGTTRRGVDCSGFVQNIFRAEGIYLPRTAREQFNTGRPVSRNALLPGDLVFFNTQGPISHVGLYIGNQQFIHAANPRRGVRIDKLTSPYYNNRYAGARRLKNFS